MSLEDDFNRDFPKEDRRYARKLLVRGALWLGAIIIVGGLFFGVIGYACSWGNAAKDIVSPANVKNQYALAYDDYEAMGALAKQACRFEALVAETDDAGIKAQRQTQLIAVENRYDTVKGEYQARIDDLFRARIVRPRDLPARAPTLKERQDEVCD